MPGKGISWRIDFNSAEAETRILGPADPARVSRKEPPSQLSLGYCTVGTCIWHFWHFWHLGRFNAAN